jgi:hypothetical protein
MRWNGRKIEDTHSFFGKTSPFLKFYKKVENNAPFLVYQTEVVKDNLSPKFNMIDINLGKLINCDRDAPIKVELWDYVENGDH